MNQIQYSTVRSRDNPLFKELRKLAQDASRYRKSARFWVEGDHLCHAALARGWRPAIAVLAESAWPKAQAQALAQGAVKTVLLTDSLFMSISGLESSPGVGCVLDLPQTGTIQTGLASVILDRVQDPGNVGSILRSAAAFGFRQVLALKGSAALWSAKVLRAGMGAHFGLHLVEGAEVSDLDALGLPLLVTSSHQGELIQRLPLPWPCAWVLGHEGQGVQQDLLDRAALQVRIAQPGGEESLNVAAAAAIVLHASALSQVGAR